MTGPLGKPTSYPQAYDRSLLVALPRAEARARAGLAQNAELPFGGVDVWNAWELSWLDPRGRPVVASGELRVPCDSPRLVESKSLKLYLNSLNGERFASAEAFAERVLADLEPMLRARPELILRAPGAEPPTGAPEGESLDGLEVDVEAYRPAPELLDRATDPSTRVDETLHSHLLKTNCPVTGQPDWATVQIRWRGPRLDRAALLRYLVSFRGHDDFHEACVERIFLDLKARGAPEALTVFARYTRRGGLDINPFRSDFETLGAFVRLGRQ